MSEPAERIAVDDPCLVALLRDYKRVIRDSARFVVDPMLGVRERQIVAALPERLQRLAP